MKHAFKQSFTTEFCADCGRSNIDHTDEAICESCSNVGPCEIIGTILMCSDCQQREANIIPTEVKHDSRDRIVQLLNQLDKDIPTDRRQYFTMAIESIVDTEKQVEFVENPKFALAELVSARIKLFQERIISARREIQEAQGGLQATQRYLNQLVPQLREEERAKFREYDISYKPTQAIPTSAPTKPGQRKSATEKSIESFAKMMNISYEQAEAALKKAVIAQGVKCSCAETPGLCKLHPKS